MGRSKSVAQRRGLWAAEAYKPAPTKKLSTRVARSALRPTHVYTGPKGMRGEVIRFEPPPRKDKRTNGGTISSGKQDPRDEDGQQHTHIFFIPGNPAVIEFYRRWMHELMERLPLDVRERTTLHGLGMPGHDLRSLNGANLYGIQEHCRYVLSYMESSHVSPMLEDSKVILIGHSYGAYQCLRIMNQRRELAARAHYIMLMPAIVEMGASRTLDVRLLTQEAAAPIAVPIATGLLSLLPRRLRKRIISAMNIERSTEQVMTRFLDGKRAYLYRNALSLARNEVRDIHDPRNEPCSSLLTPDRCYLYWTLKDNWCDRNSVRVIRAAFGNLTVEQAPQHNPVTHAFSLTPSSLEAVARSVAAWTTGIHRRD